MQAQSHAFSLMRWRNALRVNQRLDVDAMADDNISAALHCDFFRILDAVIFKLNRRRHATLIMTISIESWQSKSHSSSLSEYKNIEHLLELGASRLIN